MSVWKQFSVTPLLASAALATFLVLTNGPAFAQLTKVTFASWGPPDPTSSYLFTTAEKGFFKEAGIDFEFVVSQGTADALRRVLTGDAQFAQVSIRYEMAHQTEAAGYLRKYLAAPMKPDALEPIIGDTDRWINFPATEREGLGYTEIASLTPVEATLHKASLIKNDIDVNQLVTNEFQHK